MRGFARAFARACGPSWVRAFVGARVCACMHAACVHACMCECVCACACVCMHACMHARTHAQDALIDIFTPRDIPISPFRHHLPATRHQTGHLLSGLSSVQRARQRVAALCLACAPCTGAPLDIDIHHTHGECSGAVLRGATLALACKP